MKPILALSSLMLLAGCGTGIGEETTEQSIATQAAALQKAAKAETDQMIAQLEAEANVTSLAGNTAETAVSKKNTTQE
jgi:hypothetical protein